MKMKLPKHAWILAIVLALIIIIPDASALSYKTYDSEHSLVVIRSLPFFQKMAEIQLIENTYQCDENCYAIIKIHPYWDINKKDAEKFIFEFFEIPSNKRIDEIPDANLKEVSLKIVNDDLELVEYEPQNFQKGKDIFLRLEGKKNPAKSVEWIPTFLGQRITEWALWSAFNNSLTAENLTFIGGSQNITRYLSIYKNANVGYGSMSLNGYNSSNYTFFENDSSSATVAYGNDCHSSYPCENANDSNWDTSATPKPTGGDYNVYENFTKPTGLININFTVKVMEMESNCNTTIYCYNNTDWKFVYYTSVCQNYAGNPGNIYGNISVSLPNDCLNNIIQMKTYTRGGGGMVGQWYYEGKISGDLPNGISLYPTNPYLEIGTPDGIREWNHTGELNETNSPQNISDFSSKLNSVLSTCSCTGCSLDANNCTIPFLFHSDTAGILRYYNINITTSEAITTTQNYPANGYSTSSSSQSFSCNTTANSLTNENVTLYIWNAINSTVYQNTINLDTQSFNSSVWSVNLPYSNIFKWNCFAQGMAYDNTLYSDWGNSNYTITLEVTPPLVSITYPIATNYTINVSALNYTASSIDLQACWYSLNYGQTNTTITCGQNATGLTSTEGSNTWTVWVNDTYNNQAVSNVTFFKDTVYPSINYISPTPINNFNTTNRNFTVTIGITESNLNNITFRLYNSSQSLINESLGINSLCYQETANQSTVGDGNCGLNYTGTYQIEEGWSSLDAIDGNWATSAYDDSGIIYVNYTKPAFAYDATWEIKRRDSGVMLNLSIPLSCWNYNPNKLILGFKSTYLGDFPYPESNTWWCYNGTWATLSTESCTYCPDGMRTIYEEAIIWNTTSYSQTYLNLSDDKYYYNATAIDIFNHQNSTETRSITIDNIPPALNIIIPSSNQVFASNLSIPLNYSVSDSGAGVGSCWYNIDSQPINNLVNCQNTTFNTSIANHILYLYANDTAGNINSTNVNFTAVNLNYNYNQTYNPGPVFELTSQTFISVIQIPPSWSVVPKFIYDNVNYTSGISILINDTIRTFSKTIIVPLANYDNENKSFYWQYNVTSPYNTTIENTIAHNQTLTLISFQLCNESISNTSVINFTTRDEITGLVINETDFSGTFNFGREYSFDINNDTDGKFNFCISPSYASITSDLTSDYGKDGYTPRTYYLNDAVLDNITNSVDLFLFSDTEAVKFYFTAWLGTAKLQNAVISVSKYYPGEGVYKTIGVRESDTSGNFIEYLELDKQYRFSAVKDGTFIGTLDITAYCTATPCEIRLQYSPASADFWQEYENYYDTDIVYNFDWDPDTAQISYAFTDLTATSQYSRLVVYLVKYNQTSFSVCDKTLESTSGTITCNVSDYMPAQFQAKAYISRSPDKLVDIYNIAFSGLREAFKNTGGLGLFISLIFIITVGLIGAWNPPVGIAFALLAFYISYTIGILELSITSVIAVIILGGIIIVKMRS